MTVAAAFTPEQLAMIERQRAYFASDDLIRDRAALWADASPEECLAGAEESCHEAAFFLERLTGDELERALAPDRLPDDAIAILSTLCRPR